MKFKSSTIIMLHIIQLQKIIILALIILLTELILV